MKNGLNEAIQSIAKANYADFFRLMNGRAGLLTDAQRNQLAQLEGEFTAKTTDHLFPQRLLVFAHSVFEEKHINTAPRRSRKEGIAPQKLLESLAKELHTKNLVLQGVSGAGKTTFARMLATEFEKDFEVIFWQDQHGKDVWKVQEFAEQLTFLAHDKFPCLLVLDDLPEERNADLLELQQRLKEWRILVTTHGHLSLSSVFRQVEFTTSLPTAYKIFDHYHLLHLRTRRLKWWQRLWLNLFPPKAPRNDLQRLCQMVGNNPLCLELVARTIVRWQKPLSDILERVGQLASAFEDLPIHMQRQYKGVEGTNVYACLKVAFGDILLLNDTEKFLLETLALLPAQAWKQGEWVQNLSLPAEYAQAEVSLKEKGWIEQDWGKWGLDLHPQYRLHSLTRLVILHILVPTWAKHLPTLQHLATDAPRYTPCLYSFWQHLHTRPITSKKAIKLYEVGETLQNQYYLDLALACFVLCADTWKQAEEPYHASLAYENQGDIHNTRGDADKALACYEQGLALLLPLYAENPDDDDYTEAISRLYGGIGDRQMEVGKTQEAKATFQAMMQVDTRFSKKYPQEPKAQRNLGIAYERLGNVFAEEGLWEEALKHYQKALTIRQALQQAHPEPPYIYSVAIAHSKVGDAHKALQNLAEAHKHYEQYIALMQNLHDQFPHNLKYAQSLGIAHQRMGILHQAQKEWEQALTHFEADVLLSERLYQQHPQQAGYVRGLAIAYGTLAEAQRHTGKDSEAEQHFQQALGLKMKLHQAHSAHLGFKRDLAISHENLGGFYANRNPTEAFGHYEESMRLAKELVRQAPAVAEFRQFLAHVQANLAKLVGRAEEE